MIKIGNAPCSWGVIENVEGERSNYVPVLDEIAGSGYAGTELGDWGFMPTDSAKLHEELSSRNLELMASWVTVYLNHPDRYEECLRNALRTAKQLEKVGVKPSIINLGDEVYEIESRTKKAGRITPDMSLNAVQFENFAKTADKLGKAIFEETGVNVVVHHHIGTLIETPWEIDTLMELTDPNSVGLCFDTGHCLYGGGDPLETVKKHRSRVKHVHFKDCSRAVLKEAAKNEWGAVEAISNGVFPELGQGDVDFKAVLDFLKESAYSGWIIVEQDILPGMGTPYESAKRNREFIRSLGC